MTRAKRSLQARKIWERLKAWKDEPAQKDDAFVLSLAVLFWLILWIESPQTLIFASLAGGAWLAGRFRKVRFFLIWLLLVFYALLSGRVSEESYRRMPEEGDYRIEEIRKGYAIASDQKTRVLVYEPERYELDEIVALSSFEEIHALNNTGLFSFEYYARSKGIAYCGSPKTVTTQTQEGSTGQTIKRNMWRWINSRKARGLYRLLFYGINENENMEWIGTLGLPYLGLLGVIRKILLRYVQKEKAGWILLGLQAAGALLLPITVSMVRLFCFGLCRQLFENRDKRLAFSLLLPLLVMPSAARSMAYVLPSAIVLSSRFVEEDGRKRIVSSAVSVFVQILFTQKVNLLFLACFLIARQLLGCLFLISIPGLWIEDYGLYLQKLFEKMTLSLDVFEITGYAPFWYAIAFGICLIGICWKWTGGRLGALLVLLAIYPNVWKLDPFFHVYSLSVGQGDATVIVEPYARSVVMIDAAGRFNHDNASELFVPFLKSRQIDAIDALIVTHGDFDHDGSVEALMEQFEVRQCIRSSSEHVPVDYAFELLLEQRRADPEDENDKSLISYFSYDGYSYLWTGDASVQIEEQLIEQYALRADVLKLGHHGSDTSSSRAFLKEVAPKLAVISAGYHNRYGHPSNEVLLRLNELGIDRLNTADHGMIHLMSFGGILFFSAGDGLCGIIPAAKISGNTAG